MNYLLPDFHMHPEIRAEYRGEDLVGADIKHPGEGWEKIHDPGKILPTSLEGSALKPHQTVVFKGHLVPTKMTRKLLLLFSDIECFGKSSVFETLLDLMNYLCSTPLGVPATIPADNLDVGGLYLMSEHLPYRCDKYRIVPNSGYLHDNRIVSVGMVEVPQVTISGTVDSVSWSCESGKIVPSLSVQTKDGPEKIGGRSLVAIQAHGVGIGSRVLVFKNGQIHNMDRQPVKWPSRCPVCNNPTKVEVFHLVCEKCKGTK